jgi:hypothetical protein
MAQFNETFDAANHAPREAVDVLPDGQYIAIIEASEWKKTKKGDGAFLELTLQVVDGACKGRKVWDRLNLDNPNAVAVEIAQGTLSAICHATGVMKVSDSSQLHSVPMLVRVKVKAGENGPQNEIKGYKKLGGGSASVVGAVGPVASATTASAPAAPAVAPWMKKSAA